METNVKETVMSASQGTVFVGSASVYISVHVLSSVYCFRFL